MGTWVIVAVKGPTPEISNRAIDAAFEAVVKVQTLMSAHDETSDVGRLAKQPAFEPMRVDPWTHEVLSLGEKISWWSGGVFDVTIGGKLAQKGFLSQTELKPLSGQTPGDGFFTRARYTDIDLLHDSRVMLRRPCRVDLGGIAKGFAVDRALEAALKIEGVSDVVINAGGDLRVKTRKPQEIWLRDPFQADRFWPGGISKEGAFASSGGREAVRESHEGKATPLAAPGAGRFEKVLPGVTVAAGECALADALTKVVLLAPAATAQKTLDHFGAQASHGRRWDRVQRLERGPADQLLAPVGPPHLMTSFHQNTKHPDEFREKIRLAMPHRRSLYLVIFLLWFSGLLWLILRGFSGAPQPGQACEQWSPVLMEIHGGVAFIFLWFLGSLLVHMRRGLFLKRNRFSGLSMLSVVLFLTFTGWGLYYFGDENLRRLTSLAHWIVGLGLPFLLTLHILWGRKVLRFKTPR